LDNNEYLAQWVKWHQGYERRATKILKRAIIATTNRIPIENVSYNNYKISIPVNTFTDDITKAYIQIYTEIGLIHGNRVGLGINRDAKEYDRPFFNQIFKNNILNWIAENCGLRIRSVTRTIAEKIALLIGQAQEDELTNEQMRVFLKRNLDKGILNKYELNRIVRTETTGAANHGAMLSAEDSGLVMDKVWIATKDSRTRFKPENQFDHRVMDGKLVGHYEDFVLRSKNGIEDRIQYPGAPDGSAGDIINCRCTFAFVPRRDADGFVIRS
jgi:hypothetical protein